VLHSPRSPRSWRRPHYFDVSAARPGLVRRRVEYVEHEHQRLVESLRRSYSGSMLARTYRQWGSGSHLTRFPLAYRTGSEEVGVDVWVVGGPWSSYLWFRRHWLPGAAAAPTHSGNGDWWEAERTKREPGRQARGTAVGDDGGDDDPDRRRTLNPELGPLGHDRAVMKGNVE